MHNGRASMSTKTSRKKKPTEPVEPGNIPRIDPNAWLEEDDDRPKREIPPMPRASSMSRAELLWENYAIQPSLPLRTKIEQLMLLWRLPAVAMADLLEIDVEVVKSEIAALNEEWADLGRPLDEDTRQIVRGQTIADLRRLKTEIEKASTGNPDSRLLTLKMQVIERLTKIQGIEMERRDTTMDDVASNPVEEALGNLTAEQRAELHTRLRNKQRQMEIMEEEA